MIQRASNELGVPVDRTRRILYWHSRRQGQAITDMSILEGWLTQLDKLVSSYNQTIILQQLRRQGPAVSQEQEEH